MSSGRRAEGAETLGRGYQPGQEFRPPPDGDAGFEFSGQGFSPHEAAEFSDFFANIFGGMGGAPGNTHTRSGSHLAQGEDHHAKVVPDIEDSFIGVIVLNTPFPSGVSA